MADQHTSFTEKICEKLSGFEFWRKSLNSAKHVVAPMVDQSELAWRLLSRRHGAELCYSPMYHSGVFVKDEKYRREVLFSCKEDRPLIVQFCGNNPETILKAAKCVEHMCDAVDINLGCPQSIAKRGHYGAFLQDEWDLLHRIVSLCHENLRVPVTCKMRIFEDIGKTVRYAKMLEAAGCQLLTVHGRTREQKGRYTGLANWKHIKAVKASLKIPVFANGNIQYLKDVESCMKETGVDGVMSAEGNLHNPAIFSGVDPYVWDMGEEYLELVKMYPCNLSYIRGHLFKILHHSLVKHQEARNLLCVAKNVADMSEVVNLVKTLSQDDVAKYKENPSEFTKDLPLPYWICQPYVRPKPKDSVGDEIVIIKKKEPCKRLNVESIENNIYNGIKLSKNQLKKLRRNPSKKFQPRTDIFDKCPDCGNPRGRKCLHLMCKLCCKKKCYTEILNCEGHNHLCKDKHDYKKQCEEKEKEEISLQASEDNKT